MLVIVFNDGKIDINCLICVVYNYCIVFWKKKVLIIIIINCRMVVVSECNDD